MKEKELMQRVSGIKWFSVKDPSVGIGQHSICITAGSIIRKNAGMHKICSPPL
jgi:hypothetical protein